MALTIGEANAVNVVLRDLLIRHRQEEEQATPGSLSPEPIDLVDAAALLAEKANKALGAGLTGAQIRAALTTSQES